MTFFATEKSLLFVARRSWSCNLSFSQYVASVKRHSSTNCICFCREISSSLFTMTNASLVVMTIRSRMACDRSRPSLTSSIKAIPPFLFNISKHRIFSKFSFRHLTTKKAFYLPAMRAASEKGYRSLLSQIISLGSLWRPFGRGWEPAYSLADNLRSVFFLLYFFLKLYYLGKKDRLISGYLLDT